MEERREVQRSINKYKEVQRSTKNAEKYGKKYKYRKREIDMISINFSNNTVNEEMNEQKNKSVASMTRHI